MRNNSQSFIVHVIILANCIYSFSEAFTVCVVHDPPFTICPSSSYDGFVQNETAVTGFDVELLRWVLTNAKYTHDPASGFSDPFFKVYAWRCSLSLVWNQVDVSSYTDALSSSGPYPASSPANVSQPPLPTPHPGSSSPRGTPDSTIPTPADARPVCDISVGKLPVLSALAAD
ncbi:hypothetical protein CEUSTIGMA_g7057.t1 [Chlamydomonas eustigma]|uniref:Uncharacterized protein n=1 Tax=Chlamydomonas eustigma TaxID=1157962 RepID=A0A250X976_9CHLO|nr:hypothetical protein CEUSTIGMA_g7057.t1 [Chlamydomonas eustigma]|eukprot:GAX79616.1 hypothetical protein CEUSTIGMA_g7057.t1 [Chlamydomonas eustigma]